jgi:hypothetical protein
MEAHRRREAYRNNVERISTLLMGGGSLGFAR